MDPDLLGNLLDQHAAALELFARQWCDVPEDVVQDAFLKLAAQRGCRTTRLPGCSGSSATGPSTRVRPPGAEKLRDGRSLGHIALVRADPDERPGAIDPEEAASELQALPIGEREVIVAHLWGGLTFEQIAGVAGCSQAPRTGSYKLRTINIE